VPEINLTPQLEARARQRFAHLGEAAIVAMHSGMTPAAAPQQLARQRTCGTARIVLGTRLAVLALDARSCELIVVDEEHVPQLQAARRGAVLGA
jgi:primosomal protein N' (replication factor Y)